MLSKEIKVLNRGQTICKEGMRADKVIIILSGELEVVKTNLSSLYYSHETGVLGVKENCSTALKKKESILKSDVALKEDPE